MKKLRRFTLTRRLLTAGASVSLFFSFSHRGDAQQEKPEPEAPAKGCVWKLSDGDNTVYLAGSVHLLREEDYPIPDVYDLAYADSAKVVFEIDMKDMLGDGGAEIQRLGMYPADDSLSNHLSEEAIGRIVDYLKDGSVPIPPQALERLKPGMIFLTISALEVQKLGAKPELGLEMHFFQKTTKDEKPTGGLETVAYQMSRFDEFTDEEVEKLITQTLDELDTMPKVIDQIITGWKSGDAKGLDKLLNEQMEDEERLRDLLLVQRNKNWIPEIEKALEGEENVMFIVGAAHLIGEDSVIDLLKKKGYDVKRVLPAAQSEALKKAA